MSVGSPATSSSAEARGRIARDVLLAAAPLALSVVVTSTWLRAPIASEAYLPFHTLVELFAATVSLLVFSIGWNTPMTEQRPGIARVSAGFLAVGLLDVAHLLSYRGMPPFVTPSGPEKAIYFWLAARLAAALTLLAMTPATERVERVGRALPLAASLGFVAAVLAAVLGAPEVLPTVFVQGRGLTAVKVLCEVVITAATAAACALLYRAPDLTRDSPRLALARAALVIALGEVPFALYRDVHDGLNAVGHVYKGVAYFLVYRAIVVDALRAPYARLQASHEALRESESRFRQLAENVREMFWLRELDGRLVYMSPGFETIFGCSVGAVRDVDDPAALVHPDDRARVREHSSLARPGERHVVEHRIARPDGVERWVRAVTFPVLDAAGRVVRLAGVALDVTEERRAAETLARAQRMEALGRVAGGVAHDFNNLLTVVFASVDFAREGIAKADPVQEELTQIAEAARRARDLTQQLLAFARRQPAQPRRFDLGEVVAEVARMSRSMLGSSVELSVVVEPGVYPVTADPALVEQVLLNVVVNAKDAMPRGGALTLSLARAASPPDASAPPGRWARLRVVDTGAGMSAEVMQRAFDPFFTTKPLGRGTGLGLATSFGIVSQAGGHITLDSAPGEGTTVTILLPISEGALDAPAPEPEVSAQRGRGETILLAEDEPVVRDFTARMLRDGGYAVLVAANGLEAMEVAAAHAGPIDLLLSDVVMPLSGGAELAARLIASRPGARVLFVSGYTGDAGDALAHPVVPKPYTRNTLLQRVREALDAPARAATTR